MAKLQCIVVTPDRTVCDVSSGFVALSLYDGEIGIAPGHAPMIGRLGYGEVRIRDDVTRRYYVEGGFVEVKNNVVSVLTHRAIPAEQLDVEVCQQELSSARARKAHTPELITARQRAVAQCRARLRVARRAL